MQGTILAFFRRLITRAKSLLDLILENDSRSTWLRLLFVPVVAGIFLIFLGPLGVWVGQALEFIIDNLPSLVDRMAEIFRRIFDTGDVVVDPSVIYPPGPGRLDIIRRIAGEIRGESLQLFLLPAVGFWFVYRLFTHYVKYTYEFKDFKSAARMVRSIYLPWEKRRLRLINGKDQTSQAPDARDLYGGQLSVYMEPGQGFAVAFERPHKSVHLIGPGNRFPFTLPLFVHLRQVIDLHDQRLVVSAEGLTRDGMRVKVSEVGFISRVAGTRLAGRRQQYDGYDPQSVHQLVYQHWVGESWENPTKRVKSLQDFITTELMAFLSSQYLVNLLPEIPDFRKLVEIPADRQPMLEQFCARFNQKSSQHGLQLRWTGRGDWSLRVGLQVADVQETWQLANQNRNHNNPQFVQLAAVSAQHNETERMLQHLIRSYDEMRALHLADDRIILELTRMYFDRLQQMIRIFEARGDEIPEALGHTARHLGKLI